MSIDGPWVRCPWCGGEVPLVHFVASDEEPDAQVAVCPSCGRRAVFHPPRHPAEGP